MADPTHIPVLLPELLAALPVSPDAVVVDCTLGLGGHARALAQRLGPTGTLLALEWDPDALAVAVPRLEHAACRVIVEETNFARLPEILARHRIPAVHALVADLGLSSLQLDSPRRGFSFQADAPLDMRMSPVLGRTAAEVLARMKSQDQIEECLRAGGVERGVRRLAGILWDSRRAGPLQRTGQLVDMICGGLGGRRGRIHPATGVFQALRMAVNTELDNLRRLLEAIPAVLAPGGRAAVIAFHSGEDGLVKNAFREAARAGRLRLVTKKPMRPGRAEVLANPRSRSARLRVVERLPAEGKLLE